MFPGPNIPSGDFAEDRAPGEFSIAKPESAENHSSVRNSHDKARLSTKLPHITNPYRKAHLSDPSMPDLRTLHGQHRADSNDAPDPKPVPKQLTKFELQKDETAIMIYWQYGLFVRFVFSPYWRTPFCFNWQPLPINSLGDVVEAQASPVDNVRVLLPTNLERHGPFAMCPFSKRLALVTIERDGLWSQERYTCVIYCTNTAKRLAHISLKETKIRKIAISPDGNFIAFGGAVETASVPQGHFFVTIRRVSDGSVMDRFETSLNVFGNSVKAIAFDPEGKRLMLLCQDKFPGQIYLLVRDLKPNGSGIFYHTLARPISNKHGPTKYFLSSVLLFLPDHSIVIMFDEMKIFRFPSHCEVQNEETLWLEGPGVVETASERAYPNERLHPQGRLYAVRIPWKRWNSGVNPVNIDIYGQMQ